MPPDNAHHDFRFARFEIIPAERVLRIDGQAVALGARAFDLLLTLAERRDRVVGKQELLDLVWPGVFVEEHNIAAQISTLRKLLGARAIATVPGRGYRLTAPLRDGAIDATPLTAPPPAVTHGPAPSHLPHELTLLLGRVDEVAAVAALLQRSRLVTLVGAGGIGKSLLAQHLLKGCSADWTHGVCWVELASVADAAALPLRIAGALGVRAGAGEPLAGLCAAVSSLTMLVALDNAEHLLDAVGRTASALLEAAPGLRLLVTSQAPLRLAAEQVYRVGPLAMPNGPLPAALAQSFAAVALFVERARGADARFVLTDATAPAAIELCRQLDGLPLAIELAAARAPLLGVARLAASMQSRLQLLTRNRNAAAPERQQTLRAALEWSHSLLDERARTVFRRLGVMADSASLPFIQQVAADEHGPLDAWAVLDALDTLVNHSLVAVLCDEEPGTSTGIGTSTSTGIGIGIGIGDARDPRYRLLESPRLFAIEQLQLSGEEQQLRRRHANALALLFNAAWDERWSGRIGAQEWSVRLMADASNARDAIRWAQQASEWATVVAIASTLFLALPKTAHPERMALGDLCESLAEHVAPEPLRLRAWQVAVRPMFHRQQQQSLVVATRAVALARKLDHQAPERWPLYQALGLWIEAAAVVHEPALAALHEALAELTALEHADWPAHRRNRGLEAQRLACAPLGGAEQPADQLRLTRQLLAGRQAEGDDTAPIMGALIDAELACGHAQAALSIGQKMLDQLVDTRDDWSRLMVQTNLALTWLALDDPARARPLLRAVWPLALRYELTALCSDDPALLAALEGRQRTAALLAGYADEAYTTRGLIRHPNETASRLRTHTLARAALGAATFERLVAQGRHLRDDQIEALTFAAEDSP